LDLPSVAVRGDQAPASDLGCVFRAVVATHDMQGKVQPGREACRGEHLAVVDVEHVGQDLEGARPSIV
jgi:hypothetical protein